MNTTRTLTAGDELFGRFYRIDGLRDAGTGLVEYRHWKYLGKVNGWFTFEGSTADLVWVRPTDLVRVGRSHFATVNRTEGGRA